jgi:hypothetical protein
MPYGDGQVREGFSPDEMFKLITDATADVKKKLKTLKGQGTNISIADMFEMQMLMNHRSQLSEMSTGVISASNSAIASMARNVKT